MTVALVLMGLLLVVAALAVAGTRAPALDPLARRAGWAAEVVLVGYVAWDLLGLRGGDRPDSMVTHLGYAVAAVGLIPVLIFRAPVEPGAEGSAEPAAPASLWVLAVACVACAVVVVRMAQTR